MKKIALSNLIFGLVSIIYFIVFWQLAIENHLMPNENNQAIILSVAFGFFTISAVVFSSFMVIYGAILMLVMKKTTPSIFMGIDCIFKGGFVFISAIFTVIFIAWGFVAAYISSAIYTITVFALAVANNVVKKQRSNLL